jgi:hypothetical protein
MKKLYFLFSILFFLVVKGFSQCSVSINGYGAFCSGYPDTLIGVTSGTTGSLSYQWMNGASNIPGATQSFYVASSTGDYTLIVQDGGICQDTSQPVLVTINTSPSVSITRSGDNLYATGNGAYYTWEKNGLGISNNNYCVIDSAGIYTVIASNFYGCQTSVSDSIKIDTLSGVVMDTLNNPIVNATVYLLKFNPQDSSITFIDTTVTGVNGEYFLNTFYSKVYIYVFPDSTLMPFQMPTYFNSSLVFQDATVLNVSSNLGNINFQIAEPTNSGGTGVISGIISFSPNGLRIGIPGMRMASGGTAVSGLRVILTDQNNKPVHSTFTNSSGYFQFSNLSYGNYKVWVDKPYINNINAPVITLSSAINKTNDQYILHKTSLERVTLITSATSSSIINNIEVYPNPTNDVLNIVLGNIPDDLSYSLTDMTGRLILEGKESVTVDVSGISKGIYMMKIQMGNEIVYKKMIVE